MRAKEFVIEYKQYPTREYEGVTFTMVEKDGQLIVKALNDFGLPMGHVVFGMDGKELDPKDLEVYDKYQGQGIARVMYDYIKSQGFTIIRSFDQTDAGKGFWDKHRGEDSYVWEGVDADQVLQYVKQAHAPDEFDIEHSITDHPAWELKNIPVSQLKLDPDGEAQDPYGRVNWVDFDKVQDLLPKISAVLKRMPIVVDSEGWIIDGNHRATAAAEAGLKSVPAYVPVKQNVNEAFDQPYPLTWERGDFGMDALARLPDGSPLSIMFNDEYDYDGNEITQVEFHRNHSQSVTGEGDAQRIFATVLAAIQQFIKDERPKRITFAADKEAGPSRANLYKRLVDRFARPMGYQVDTHEAGTSLYFDLTRRFGIRENMDHSKDGRAVEELKAALLARKDRLQAANDDQVYDIIDKIMTRIAKSHSISGQELHDMWVDKYNEIPDTWIMNENFADGKNPGRKGLAKRVGVNCKQPVSKLRSIAAHSSGEKQRMAHWCANMKSGKKKANEEEEDFVGPYDGHNFGGAQIG